MVTSKALSTFDDTPRICPCHNLKHTQYCDNSLSQANWFSSNMFFLSHHVERYLASPGGKLPSGYVDIEMVSLTGKRNSHFACN